MIWPAHQAFGFHVLLDLGLQLVKGRSQLIGVHHPKMKGLFGVFVTPSQGDFSLQMPCQGKSCIGRSQSGIQSLSCQLMFEDWPQHCCCSLTNEWIHHKLRLPSSS